MFLVLFLVLLFLWLMGWTAFHVAGGLIHITVLVFAVISLIVHIFRGSRTRCDEERVRMQKRRRTC